MSSNGQIENGKKLGRSLYPWHFDKYELMSNTASRQDGMSYEEELNYRQLACKFLHEMVTNLTHSRTDQLSSLATGVAAVFINRFYKFHSFKMFDYRDIAAACLFLSGKSEDSPRKLKYVVTQWWHLKFPNNKDFQSEEHFFSACDLIVYLENIVLMTMAFDMNVDLPHQYVLKIMQKVEKGRSTYKEMVKTAYYLVTDILMVTDWSIRYSCSAIAAACINIAAFFHDLEVSKICPPDISENWFVLEDRSVNIDVLKEMTKEFIDIFSKRPDLHYGSLKRLDPKGKVEIVNSSPGSFGGLTGSLLPPPPAAPILQPKKLDMSAYKERQRHLGNGHTDSPRQSFLPDVQNPAELKREMEKVKREEHHHRSTHHHQNTSSNSHHNHNHHAHSHNSGNNHHHQHHHQSSSHRSQHHSVPNGHSSHNNHHHSNNHRQASTSNDHHRSRSGSTSSKNGSASHSANGSHHHNHGSGDHRRHEHHERRKPDERHEIKGVQKRNHVDYNNDYQQSDKRMKVETPTNFVASDSAPLPYHKAAHNSNDRSTPTEQVEMSTYAKVAAAVKVNYDSNGFVQSKSTTTTASATSTYQQMCMDMTQRRSSGIEAKSMDPSPPAMSPPFSHQNSKLMNSSMLLHPPPHPPSIHHHRYDDMEDGEVR